MKIKEKLREVRGKAKEGINQWHSKDNRRKISQKITTNLGLQGVVDKARTASDSVKVAEAEKRASKGKLAERSLLKLDAETHKKLLNDSIAVWPGALSGKSLDQIGKYLDRAYRAARAERLDWPWHTAQGLSEDLRDAFVSGENPFEYALKRIADIGQSEAPSEAAQLPHFSPIATLEKLAHIYSTALMAGLEHAPDAQKKNFFERVKRNSKNNLALVGKELELAGKTLQQKAVRLPSSTVNGAANVVVAAPLVGGGAAMMAAAVAVIVGSHGVAAPIFFPFFMGLGIPGGLATLIGSADMARGTSEAKEKKNRAAKESSSAPPAYKEASSGLSAGNERRPQQTESSSLKASKKEK